ncbi:hypothetical protein [Pseudomonas aeruginosa]|uniref:hypothetical protein n=1 Tax=Pseudomonas aeruginosa TaxID=287 RepID=UPI00106935A0|nr:hypothetical protein [Pseudomonas aeruginosa]MCO3670877.1 hypothetical protein [Pseudomonas aeruginosa]HBO9019088.1 hypothetical protein [Pseudomonas aeruginosa]HEH9487697.1 hypothetical protein [Pseudomonas aeruginosa]
MVKVFIIGLPNLLRRRVESSLENRGISPSIILADIDRVGRLKLLPDPSQAADRLRDYCESQEGGYDCAEVYILPYTPIPDDLDGELDALEDMGAQVIAFQMEQNGWPYLHAAKPKLNQGFLDGVFDALFKAIVGAENEVEEDPLPSVYVQQACERTPNFIVVGNAINRCDSIAESRRIWVKQAIDAFLEIIALRGNTGGTLNSFFGARQLYFARTGGISVKLDVMIGGQQVHTVTTSEHLKKGDHTTPQAAVRIYYHLATLNDEFYVFLLYLGPHPEMDISYIHHLN